MDDQTAKPAQTSLRIQRRVAQAKKHPLLIRLYENERVALEIVARAHGLTLNKTVAWMLRGALEIYDMSLPGPKNNPGEGLLPEKKKWDDDSLF